MIRFSLLLQLLLLAAVVAVSVPLIAGFFGAWHAAFDSLAHFRVHLAVVLMLGAAALLFTTFRLPGLAALVLGASALSTAMGGSFIPGLGPVQAALQPRDDSQAVYRLLQLNLRFDNPEYGKVLSLIGRTQPDVITLDEVSAVWAERLEPLFALYPHRVLCPYPNGIFGVAILSRRPFAEGSEPRCFDRGAFAMTRVDFGGRQADIAAIHLGWLWPFGQHQQIRRLTPALTGLGQTALMAGDLNATPWSETVKRLSAIGAVERVSVGGPTWLYHRLPEALRFAGLPIDHVFAKGNVQVHSARKLDAVGSDHLPILVEFSVLGDKPAGTPETATVSLAVPEPRG